MHCRHIARLKQLGAAEAYADDHRNDVMTNTVEVGAALAAFSVLSLWSLVFGQCRRFLYCFLYHVQLVWYPTGQEQLNFLTGRGAPPLLLQQLMYISAHYDPRIKYVDTVIRAYHFGVN